MFNDSQIIAIYCLIPLFINIAIMIFLVPGLLNFPSKESQDITPHVKAITVLLPTYNDAYGIVKALSSIESQLGLFSVDVLIINDGSTDGTTNEIDRWLSLQPLIHNYQHIVLPVNTGRKGIALSKVTHLVSDNSDVVVVMDGDTELDSYAFQHCLDELYSHPKMAAVCGMIIPQHTAEKAKDFVARAQYGELIGAFHGMKYAQGKMGCVNTLAGALVFHKMEAIQHVGWFGEWLVEDVCWTWKARAMGWRVGFANKALAFTDCPKNISQLWLQRRRWSRGRVEALKVAFKQDKRKFSSIMPWFLYSTMQIISMPGLIIAAFFSPTISLISLGVLISLHWLFASFNIRSFSDNNGSVSSFESAVWTAFILDIILFFPNARGYIDEIIGYKKSWLTR
jgi:biofilm PGA synthesis N-glycosyltransferase PgaC